MAQAIRADLVGKRNGSDLDRAALHNAREPEPLRATLPRMSDNGHGACNQQPAQMPIALL